MAADLTDARLDDLRRLATAALPHPVDAAAYTHALVAYVSAVDPPTALALLDALATARAELSRLRTVALKARAFIAASCHALPWIETNRGVPECVACGHDGLPLGAPRDEHYKRCEWTALLAALAALPEVE